MDTIILIDGNYLKRAFCKKALEEDIPKFINQILIETKINKNSLLRTYYYITKPEFEDYDQTIKLEKFLKYLEKQDSLDITIKEPQENNNFTTKEKNKELSITLSNFSSKDNIKTIILFTEDNNFTPDIYMAKNNTCKIILVHSEPDLPHNYNDLLKSADQRIEITREFMKNCSTKRL